MSNNNSLTRLTIRSCENITCLQWKWTRRIGWKKTRGGRIKDSSEDSRNGLSGPGPARSSPAGWIYKFPQLFANLRRHYIAIWGTPTWIDRRVISPNIKPRFAISPSSLSQRPQSSMNFLNTQRFAYDPLPLGKFRNCYYYYYFRFERSKFTEILFINVITERCSVAISELISFCLVDRHVHSPSNSSIFYCSSLR